MYSPIFLSSFLHHMHRECLDKSIKVKKAKLILNSNFKESTGSFRFLSHGCTNNIGDLIYTECHYSQYMADR